MTDKKKSLLSAVRLWAVSQGMIEIEDKKYIFGADIAFIKYDKFYAFLSEIDRSPDEIKKQSDILRLFYHYVYVVTNDRNKKKHIEESTTKGVGIVCNSNPFGLGYIFEILKESEMLDS